MAKKKRRGGRGLRVGKWVNLGFKIAGAVVAASPALKATAERIGTPAAIPEGVLYEYTGYSLTTGKFDAGKTAGGVAALIGGVVLAKIGGFLSKRF